MTKQYRGTSEGKALYRRLSTRSLAPKLTEAELEREIHQKMRRALRSFVGRPNTKVLREKMAEQINGVVKSAFAKVAERQRKEAVQKLLAYMKAPSHLKVEVGWLDSDRLRDK